MRRRRCDPGPTDRPSTSTSIRCGRWATSPTGASCWRCSGRAAAQAVAADTGAAWDVHVRHGHLPGRPRPRGTAEIRTTVLRRGRTASHVRAVLVQSERTMVDAVMVLGALAPGTAPRYSDIAPLRIPAPDQCVGLPPQTPEGVPVGVLRDHRAPPRPPHGPRAPRRRGARGLRWPSCAAGSGSPTAREPDAASLLYFVDAIPPATLLIGSSGWVPTLSMSVYVRARPAPGWLGIRFTADLVAAGTVDETCTLWDSDGPCGGAGDAAGPPPLPRRAGLRGARERRPHYGRR